MTAITLRFPSDEALEELASWQLVAHERVDPGFARSLVRARYQTHQLEIELVVSERSRRLDGPALRRPIRVPDGVTRTEEFLARETRIDRQEIHRTVEQNLKLALGQEISWQLAAKLGLGLGLPLAAAKSPLTAGVDGGVARKLSRAVERTWKRAFSQHRLRSLERVSERKDVHKLEGRAGRLLEATVYQLARVFHVAAKLRRVTRLSLVTEHRRLMRLPWGTTVERQIDSFAASHALGAVELYLADGKNDVYTRISDDGGKSWDALPYRPEIASLPKTRVQDGAPLDQVKLTRTRARGGLSGVVDVVELAAKEVAADPEELLARASRAKLQALATRRLRAAERKRQARPRKGAR